MTDPATDPEELRPATSEEAADIVANDPGLNAESAGDDAATDDDARTADSAPVGESRG
jgi:hypothetical protein